LVDAAVADEDAELDGLVLTIALETGEPTELAPDELATELKDS